MSDKKDFGFGGLKNIKPDAAPKDDVPAQVDRAAEERGFVSRESATLIKRREPVTAPVAQLNVRAHVADLNEFLNWCETKHITYREAFALIAKAIRKGAL